VQKVERLTGTDGGTGLTGGQIWNLLRRPSWVSGTVMLGLAIVCQLAALSFAPLILVQPLGAVSLVITTLLNARISGHKPTRQSITAITLCIAGIFTFVTIAAIYATETPVSDAQLITVLIILAAVIVVVGGSWLWYRQRASALFYIVAAGMIYGFVATLAKVVINRVQNENFDWLTIICVVALLAGTASGPTSCRRPTPPGPGPRDRRPHGRRPHRRDHHRSRRAARSRRRPFGAYIGFVIAGALAVAGVFLLARFHPEVVSQNSGEVPIARGSGTPGEPRTNAEKLTDAVAKVWPEPPVRDRDEPRRR
jgi:drug/metabolite transporter (DMT)-like permease